MSRPMKLSPRQAEVLGMMAEGESLFSVDALSGLGNGEIVHPRTRDSLLHKGFIETGKLKYGYVVYTITPAGIAAVKEGRK